MINSFEKVKLVFRTSSQTHSLKVNRHTGLGWEKRKGKQVAQF